VSASHVTRAEAEKYFRSNLIEVRVREFITRGIIMVDVAGDRIGQVNGLSVIDLGDIRFGKPSRITAKTYVGRSGVLDIEREAKMSGKIYEKGVLILGGYLSGKYAQERPLSMSASLCSSNPMRGWMETAHLRPRSMPCCQASPAYQSGRNRGYRFRQPAWRNSADRRREPEDRGVLRCVARPSGLLVIRVWSYRFKTPRTSC